MYAQTPNNLLGKIFMSLSLNDILNKLKNKAQYYTISFFNTSITYNQFMEAVEILGGFEVK